MVPPVPIPNTVVKHPEAESTCLVTGWEDRKLPVLFLAVARRHHGGFGEVVNTLDCGSSMRGFDPHKSPHFHRGIAQLVEQRSPKP